MKVHSSVCMFLLLLVFYQAQSQPVQDGHWMQRFTVDVVAPGSDPSLPARGKVDCAGHCLKQPDCKAFAYKKGSATCWLYRHLVEYTTTGMASPGTRYFWRLSPSCPGELGYQMEAGICLKIYPVRVNWTTAVETCKNDGGHLLIADTEEKKDAVFQKTSNSVWLGASDADKEGEWRWVDGTPLEDPYWQAGEPSNSYDKEHFLKLYSDGTLNDNPVNGIGSPVCQIPLAAVAYSQSQDHVTFWLN